MKFNLTKKTKFFIFGSSIFFAVSCIFSGIGFLLSLRLSFLLFGPLSGIGGWIHGLAGVIGTILGLLIGALVALLINYKLGKKWEIPERIRLTCLSFLMFLLLLWGVIVAIARM